MKREEFAKKWGHERTMNAMGLPVTIPKYDEFLADLDSLSLPPAEGAEENIIYHNLTQPFRQILQSVALHGYDIVFAERDCVKCATEFATLHAQRLAEEMLKAVFNEIWDAPVPDDVFENPDYRMSFADAKIVAEKFATLHAQQMAEKMVEERMKMVWEFIEWKDKKELRYSRMLNKYYDDTDSGTVELTIHDLWNYWNNIKNRQP